MEETAEMAETADTATELKQYLPPFFKNGREVKNAQHDQGGIKLIFHQ